MPYSPAAAPPPPSSDSPASPRRLNIRDIQDKKRHGQAISMVTAYDATQAALCAAAGIDCVLVGDSGAMVQLGQPSTLQATMDAMLFMSQAVARGTHRSLLIGDLPFMSYQADPGKAVENAGAFLAHGGMQMVKLEGGRPWLAVVRRMVDSGIPVCGHLGLLPQQLHLLGGYRRQAKDATGALELVDQARSLVEEGGISMLVLEAVPAQVAAHLAQTLPVPVIGIGSGAGCDGQVLVFHDLLGLNPGPRPSFVRTYIDGAGVLVQALSAYRQDVEARSFPAGKEVFLMDEDQWAQVEASLEDGPAEVIDFRDTSRGGSL